MKNYFKTKLGGEGNKWEKSIAPKKKDQASLSIAT
jgi:hypothetical protein